MRNMRGAFGALLFAGAAYAWKNRDRLNQQFQSMRGNTPAMRSQAPRSYDLPDLSATEQRDFTTRPTVKEREFGGTSM